MNSILAYMRIEHLGNYTLCMLSSFIVSSRGSGALNGVSSDKVRYEVVSK
jgi:hypothetical protein